MKLLVVVKNDGLNELDVVLLDIADERLLDPHKELIVFERAEYRKMFAVASS